MNAVVEDVIAFCRLFMALERDQVCCGTVSVAQCVVLQTLREGQWDISSLAETTRVTKGAMTRLIDGLEKRDFVARENAEDDGRRVYVVLTKAGRKEADRLAQLTSAAVQMVWSRIPKAEHKAVAKALTTLRKATEDVRGAFDCC